jgi:hypothetical protein
LLDSAHSNLTASTSKHSELLSGFESFDAVGPTGPGSIGPPPPPPELPSSELPEQEISIDDKTTKEKFNIFFILL